MLHTSIRSTFHMILRYGLILLLVWTPLAFGSVPAWAYALLQIHAFGLVTVWIVQHLVARRRSSSASPDPHAIVWTPLALPLSCFLALLILQILPLALSSLSFISPSSADFYRPFLPIWPDIHAPLSLRPYATRTAIGLIFAYTSLFFLTVNTFRTQRAIRAVSGAIVATAAAMALLGIMQQLTGTTAIYWFREANYASFFGPYINRNHFAGYLAMAIPLGLGLLLTQPVHMAFGTASLWRRRLYAVFGLLSPSRMLLLCALAIMTGALFLSTSRGGVLSLIVGLFLFVLLLNIRSGQLGRQAMVSMTIAAMVGMVLWLGVTPLLKRFEHLATDESTLTWAGRLPAFQAAWQMSQDFPLFGVGFEAFRIISPRYQPTAAQNPRYFNVHNDFLELLAETGWIGFGLLLGGMGLLVRDIVKRWRPRQDPFVQIMTSVGLAALFAIGLHSLVDFNLHVPANALLCTTVLALTCACVNLPRHGAAPPVTDCEAARHVEKRRVGRIVLSGLALTLALGLAFEALKVAIADVYYPQQEVIQPSHWIYQAEPADERYRLQQAMRWTPQNPWYLERLAVLETQAAWDLIGTSEFTPAVRRQASLYVQQAVTLYEQAMRQQPTEPYTQIGWLQAIEDLRSLNPQMMPPYAEALPAFYTHLASLAPASADIQYRLGVLRLGVDAGESTPPTPLSFFRQALLLDASYDKDILKAYLDVLPDAEALRHFARAVPSTAEGHLRAARLLEPSHWQQARLHYRTATILSQDDPEMLQSYGRALQRQREFAAARTIWEQITTLSPQDANAYLALADTLHQLADHAGAAQTLQELVRRFPRQADYQVRLANAYVRAGDANAAEAVWRRVLHLQPYSAASYVGLAQLYEARQDVPNALRMMQRAVSIAPGQMAYQHTLARLLEQSGHRDRAQHVYQRLAAQQTPDPQVFYKLGEYARQDGKPLQAISYYRQAVQLKPEHAGYRQALQRAVEQSQTSSR